MNSPHKLKCNENKELYEDKCYKKCNENQERNHDQSRIGAPGRRMAA